MEDSQIETISKSTQISVRISNYRQITVTDSFFSLLIESISSADKYKLYQKIRYKDKNLQESKSLKSAPSNHKPQNENHNRDNTRPSSSALARQGQYSETTPKKKRSIYSPSPLDDFTKYPPNRTPTKTHTIHDIETPEKQLEGISEIGPTPQIYGKVMGVFDLGSLTPFRSPTKSQTSTLNVSPRKEHAIPKSPSKRFASSPLKRQFDIFPILPEPKTTPKKQKLGDNALTTVPSTPSNASQTSSFSDELTDFLATPMYIHQRDTSFTMAKVPSLPANNTRTSTDCLSDLEHVDNTDYLDEDSIDFSPRKARKTFRLTNMISGYKQIKKQIELEASKHEVSDQSLGVEKPSEPNSDKEDSTEKDALSSCDGGPMAALELEWNHLGEENEGLGNVDLTNGNLPVYKKKGQKRTTKRHVFRPDLAEDEEVEKPGSKRQVKVQPNFKKLKLNNSGFKKTPNYFKKKY